MRKGQAAMEFLMTYGWAILVVLAAIGALAYFGVLSPDKFLPDKCTAAPPFSCTSYKLSNATGWVNLTLTANAGVDVTVNGISFTCDGSTYANIPATQTAPNYGGILVNGNPMSVGWQPMSGGGCTGSFAGGNKYKATYNMTYTKSGETVSHQASGSIQARVE